MRRLIPVLAILLSCAFCQAEDVVHVLSEMKKAYSSAKSAKVKLELTLPFVQEIAPEAEDPGLQIEMSYIAPNKVHVHLKSDGEDVDEMILQDGKIVWTKDEGKVDEDEAPSGDDEEDEDDEDYGDDATPHLMYGEFFSDFETLISTDTKGSFGGTDLDAHSERWNDKQWIVIQQTFSKQGVIRRLYVDPETHLIWRCTDSDLEEDKLISDLRVTSQDINVEIDPELVKPPH